MCTCIRFNFVEYFLPYDGACIYVSSGSQYSDGVSHPGYKVQTLHGLLQSIEPCLSMHTQVVITVRTFGKKNISGTKGISVAKIFEPAKHTYGQ